MLYYLAYFFGGVFFANGLPHILNGISGRAFPTPFANPPGQGESSARLNVLWGAFNLAIAYGLLLQVGSFDLRDLADASAFGLGCLLLALGLAWRFGPLYGGAKGKKRELPASRD